MDLNWADAYFPGYWREVMTANWTVVAAALAYLLVLFFVAHLGNRLGRYIMVGRVRATIYALALAVYCTSWTFFGSVGLASRSGLDFLTIYIGPILVIGFGHLALARIIRIAKAQHSTSIADFVASRYGKSEAVAALVALIAVVGAIPYIALQLKAVSSSLGVFLDVAGARSGNEITPVLSDIALVVALVLAGFSMAFGTRQSDATEHQDGIVIAVALESLVKLVAFLMVGAYVAYFMFDGLSDLVDRAFATGASADLVSRTSEPISLLTLIILSSCAALLLPRQFHMAVVENRDVRDVKRAAWLFPLYLVLINLFVLPLAYAGVAIFPAGSIDRDMTVLSLPLVDQANAIALVAFIGGLSAATAMIIVESVAIAIMISNDLIMPLILRLRGGSRVRVTGSWRTASGDLGGLVITIRRIAIISIILLAYAYYRIGGTAGLAQIGLLAFAATAQIAPAFIGGLLWKRGTALGAVAGLVTGLGMWAYTLLLPSLISPTSPWVILLVEGPFSMEALRPTVLFGTELPRLTHGVVWSLGLNLLAYVAFSLLRPVNAIEKVQAEAFIDHATLEDGSASFRFWRTSVTIDELRATVARYLGPERADLSFESYALAKGLSLDGAREADARILHFAEGLIASTIGAASSRLVLSLLLKRGTVTRDAALQLLDDASAAIQYNRDLLQNALDHASQGVTVLDKEFRLVCWNRAFRDLYDLPAEMLSVGIGFDEIIRSNAQRGVYGPGDVEAHVTERMRSFAEDAQPVRLRLYTSGRVLDVRSNRLPDGGVVTIYADISDTVAAEEALEQANETLEKRVKQRTAELTKANKALAKAKSQADEANASKTSFLAAASHDILQPLNAARLYAASLIERDRARGDTDLADHVAASLDAVEDILTTLLDISRLDAGALKPELASFRLDEILLQMEREFAPLAAEKGLKLTFVPTSLTVRSDRRLLRRLLQNLVSNAIKYTPRGRVLIGCRRQEGQVRIDVFDTGIGIPESKQKLVFQEFQRLDQGARTARGLGLGLSIVERISRVLDHPITLRSEPGDGSVFSVTLPAAAALPAFLPVQDSTPIVLLPLKGLKIIAIDNEPAILEGMQHLLSSWGCSVTALPGLDEAMEAIKHGLSCPDVIIADYHLDHGDGLSAIQKLRWTLCPNLPAVLITADRSASMREEAKAKDVHVLNKPLKPAALRALLAQWRVTRMEEAKDDAPPAPPAAPVSRQRTIEDMLL